MTQHSQNGEGVERDIAGETVLGFRVAAYRETHPGHGDAYGHTYSEHWSTPNTRDPRVKVERLFTEDQLRQSLTAREPATADVEREYIEAIDEAWQGLKQTQLAASEVGVEIAKSIREGYGLNLTLAIREALSRAAPSSGHAMAEGLHRDVIALADQYAVKVDGEYRYGADGKASLTKTHEEWRVIAAALATTPPTTNDAIPAGMVRWDGGDRAPDDWDRRSVLHRDGTISHAFRWVHTGRSGDIIAYTPKASAAPSAPATEAGEEA